jgi:glycosyltransferase involved in cell wall biosynthesis
LLTAAWGNLPAQESMDGFLIRRLRSGRRLPYKAGLGAMAGFVLASFWAGMAEIKRWKPDVIHVHFAVPGGAAAWALSRLTGIPYVLTVHLGDVPGGVPEKTGRWFRWIYPFTPPVWRGAAQVVAVSEFTRQLALKHYPVPVQMIPNGVDITALNPGNIHIGEPPGLIFAGRFVPQKNLLGLVRILSRLQDLPWKCALLGDGILHKEVEDEIAALGMQDRFILPGWVTPQEVINWLARSDILFMPSLSEGLPVVGVQALSMGLALVLSRVGGCIDLVAPQQNGFLVECDDSAGFEAALRQLLSDKECLLAYRRASRELAKRFDLNKIVEDYAQIFAQIEDRQGIMVN